MEEDAGQRAVGSGEWRGSEGGVFGRRRGGPKMTRRESLAPGPRLLGEVAVSWSLLSWIWAANVHETRGTLRPTPGSTGWSHPGSLLVIVVVGWRWDVLRLEHRLCGLSPMPAAVHERHRGAASTIGEQTKVQRGEQQPELPAALGCDT